MVSGAGGPGGQREKGDNGQRLQTSSYKMNKFGESRVVIGLLCNNLWAKYNLHAKQVSLHCNQNGPESQAI